MDSDIKYNFDGRLIDFFIPKRYNIFGVIADPDLNFNRNEETRMIKEWFKKIRRLFQKNNLKKYFIIEILVFAAIIAVDQISKAIVAANMQIGESVTAIPYLFNFYYIRNTGAAFGLFEGQRWLFIIITVIAMGLFGFLMYKMRDQGKMIKISIALIMAGALGNFIDRVALEYVRDFIQFAFWEAFPIFNIADCALVIGVVLFAIGAIFFYKEIGKGKKILVGTGERETLFPSDQEEEDDEHIREKARDDARENERGRDTDGGELQGC